MFYTGFPNYETFMFYRLHAHNLPLHNQTIIIHKQQHSSHHIRTQHQQMTSHTSTSYHSYFETPLASGRHAHNTFTELLNESLPTWDIFYQPQFLHTHRNTNTCTPNTPTSSVNALEWASFSNHVTCQFGMLKGEVNAPRTEVKSLRRVLKDLKVLLPIC